MTTARLLFTIRISHEGNAVKGKFDIVDFVSNGEDTETARRRFDANHVKILH